MNVLEFLCVAVWAMARKFKCNNNYKTKMGKETVLSLNGRLALNLIVMITMRKGLLSHNRHRQ